MVGAYLKTVHLLQSQTPNVRMSITVVLPFTAIHVRDTMDCAYDSVTYIVAGTLKDISLS